MYGTSWCSLLYELLLLNRSLLLWLLEDCGDGWVSGYRSRRYHGLLELLDWLLRLGLLVLLLHRRLLLHELLLLNRLLHRLLELLLYRLLELLLHRLLVLLLYRLLYLHLLHRDHLRLSLYIGGRRGQGGLLRSLQRTHRGGTGYTGEHLGFVGGVTCQYHRECLLADVVHRTELDLRVGHSGVERNLGDDGVVRHVRQTAQERAEVFHGHGRDLQAQHLTRFVARGDDGDALLVGASLRLFASLCVDLGTELVLRAHGAGAALWAWAVAAWGNAVVRRTGRGFCVLVRVPRGVVVRLGHAGVGVDDDDAQGEQLQGLRLLAVADDVEAATLDTDVVDRLATDTGCGLVVDVGGAGQLLHERREGGLVERYDVGHGQTPVCLFLRVIVYLLSSHSATHSGETTLQ